MAAPTVVLVYGWLGFRRILFWDYFRGVPALYAEMGIRTIVPDLPWGGSTRERSASLADQLSDEPGPVHMIAHSMGGIDARR
ncbi:MAG TPA: alpha/beta hydrolase, partial [Mariprofundaceae bacterium]|nr:alpha/beta hydrolase [Mariprofundaceae bacterium]